MHFLLALFLLVCPLFLQSDESSQPNQDFHLSPLVPTSEDKIFDPYSLSPELVAKVIDTMPQQIIDVIFTLNNKELRDKAKPKRLLLVGPPGAGKTTMAQAIAIITQRRYKVIEAPFLLNEYKNSGPQNLFRVIVPMLESGQPCVIIVDEITQLTKQHDKKRDPDPGTAVALWLLLDRCAEYDNVLFVGTCNEMDDFPEQLRSRFGDSGIVHVGLPRLQEVKEVIYHYLSDVNHSCDDRYVTYLAKKLKGKSIRDVQDFMLQGIRLAYTMPSVSYRVEPRHFDAVIKTWKPWWYPQKIYQTLLKPNVKPFWREVLPTLLQIVALYFNYRGIALQTAALILQSKALVHQIKVSQDQYIAQRESAAMQSESLDLQRKSLKQCMNQQAAQAEAQLYQEYALNMQAESLQNQKDSFAHQQKTAKEQKEAQEASLEVQKKSLAHQQETAKDQKEMQQKMFDHQKKTAEDQKKQQDESLKLQKSSLRYTKAGFIGGSIGAIGGAVVGAIAGGPPGAVAGAIAGVSAGATGGGAVASATVVVYDATKPVVVGSAKFVGRNTKSAAVGSAKFVGRNVKSVGKFAINNVAKLYRWQNQYTLM